jgi:hypothetical protein
MARRKSCRGKAMTRDPEINCSVLLINPWPERESWPVPEDMQRVALDEIATHEIRRRRMDLIKATHQIPPKGWADDLRSPDYLPPPGSDWPPGTGLRLVHGDKDR